MLTFIKNTIIYNVNLAISDGCQRQTFLNVCDTCDSLNHTNPVSVLNKANRGMQRPPRPEGGDLEKKTSADSASLCICLYAMYVPYVKGFGENQMNLFLQYKQLDKIQIGYPFCIIIPISHQNNTGNSLNFELRFLPKVLLLSRVITFMQEHAIVY